MVYEQPPTKRQQHHEPGQEGLQLLLWARIKRIFIGLKST